MVIVNAIWALEATAPKQTFCSCQTTIESYTARTCWEVERTSAFCFPMDQPLRYLHLLSLALQHWKHSSIKICAPILFLKFWVSGHFFMPYSTIGNNIELFSDAGPVSMREAFAYFSELTDLFGAASDHISPLWLTRHQDIHKCYSVRILHHAVL